MGIRVVSSSRIRARIRQKGDGPGLLDRHRQLPLMAGAGARDPSWNDLPAFAQEVPETTGILVVDEHGLVRAEAADLAPPHAAAARCPSFGLGAAAIRLFPGHLDLSFAGPFELAAPELRVLALPLALGLPWRRRRRALRTAHRHEAE